MNGQVLANPFLTAASGALAGYVLWTRCYLRKLRFIIDLRSRCAAAQGRDTRTTASIAYVLEHPSGSLDLLITLLQGCVCLRGIIGYCLQRRFLAVQGLIGLHSWGAAYHTLHRPPPCGAPAEGVRCAAASCPLRHCSVFFANTAAGTLDIVIFDQPVQLLATISVLSLSLCLPLSGACIGLGVQPPGNSGRGPYSLHSRPIGPPVVYHGGSGFLSPCHLTPGLNAAITEEAAQATADGMWLGA